MAILDPRATTIRNNGHRICKEHDVNPNYFSIKKKQLDISSTASNFMRVSAMPNASILKLTNGGVTISLPPGCSTQWLADLVRLMQCFVDPPAIYLYGRVVDFRKSINGLVVLVEQELNRSPFDPTLYLFSNKTRDKMKILYWDTSGFALWYKRLEKQRFKWPKYIQKNALNITEEQLNWLLSGYDIIGHQPLHFLSAS